MSGVIIDLFAGPGGWSEGLKMLGLADFGIEKDPVAAATRYAAGHATLVADLATLDPRIFADVDVWGIIGSPPCQAWSQAGLRLGLADERGELVWVPMEWALTLKPEWVALEQVPEVLPIWKHVASVLERSGGYRTWTGIVNAADFGLAQTRKRAILLAHRNRGVYAPEPTHVEGGERDTIFGPGRLPWVSMGEALGGDFLLHTNRDQREDGSRQIVCSDRPAPTFTAKSKGQWVLEAIRGEGMTERHGARPPRTLDEPSFTVRAWKDSRMRWRDLATGETQRFTVEHALIIQGFRPDYPVQGSDTKAGEQIGNAIPPPLAAASIAALLYESDPYQSDE